MVSTHHPLRDYLDVADVDVPGGGAGDGPPSETRPAVSESTYYDVERFDVVWEDGAEANRGTYYRRPVADLFAPALAAGFDLAGVVEPDPGDLMAETHPEEANRRRRAPPGSICLRWDR